jgi:hypothetical protein
MIVPARDRSFGITTIRDFALLILAHNARSSITSTPFEELFTVTKSAIIRCPDRILNDERLAEIVKELQSENNVRRVLVFGGNIEKQITVCALRLLAEGFDVFLPCDAILREDDVEERISALRLFQAGVVPTTARQILFEWLSNEIDSAVAAKLELILAQVESERQTVQEV